MEEVWSVFLRLMKDYEALTMTEEEAYEIFQDNLTIALSSVQLKGCLEDVEIGISQMFSRRLTGVENLILGYATVVAWLTPYVYSSELLMAQLTSTDFTQFSSSNRLQSYIKLHNEAETRLNQAILDYDTRAEYSSLRSRNRGVRRHG